MNSLTEEERLMIDMIIAEEQADVEEVSNKESEILAEVERADDKEQLLLIENTNIELSSTYTPSSETAEGQKRSLPFTGTGDLKNFVLRADSNEFSISVQVDEHNVVDSTFDELENLSAELAQISAYEADNQYIINISDYPIRDRFNIEIVPDGNVTFSLIRVEIVEEFKEDKQ